MTKCAKKYRKGAVRLMTMEMVEQDDNAVDSLTERSAGHLQNQPGQNQISSGSEVSVAASSAGRGSPAVTLVQLPSGQTVHVQGVIQATQPSVIQSPHMQAVQVASIADEAAQSEVIIDSQKRREILSRRPSYRKILNELSSDAPAVAKIEEEEKSEDEGTPSGISAVAMPTSLYHTNTGQYLTISQGGTIQTVTNSGAPQPGATIVQYAAQSSDGTQQFFVPGSQVVVQDSPLQSCSLTELLSLSNGLHEMELPFKCFACDGNFQNGFRDSNQIPSTSCFWKHLDTFNEIDLFSVHAQRSLFPGILYSFGSESSALVSLIAVNIDKKCDIAYREEYKAKSK